LNVNKLDQFLAMASKSAESLAAMGGTVLQGRKQFAGLTASLRENELSLRKLGLDQDAQAEAALGYAKIQSRLALGATKDYAAMGQSAYKYIQEQDALTKVTGISRKQQEDALEEAMRNQRFAATIDQLIAERKFDEAEQLQTGLRVARAAGKDMAAAYADMASGMVNTDAAQKGLIGSQGEMLRQINNIKSGMYKGSEEMLDAGMQEMLKKTGEFGVKMRPAAQAGVLEDFSIQYTTSMNAQTIATKNFAETMAEARKQQKGQIDNTGTILDDQAKLRKIQNETMLEFQKFVNTGLPQATAVMLQKVEKAFLETLTKVARGFNKEAGLGGNPVPQNLPMPSWGQIDPNAGGPRYNPTQPPPLPPAQNQQQTPPLPPAQNQQQTPPTPTPTQNQQQTPPAQNLPRGRNAPPSFPPPNTRAHGTSGELGSLFEPKDIIAQLHKGERVLNKDENADLSKLFNMVSGEKFQKKMMDTQGQMLKVIDSITSGMRVNSKSGAGNDFKSAYADISSSMMNNGPGQKALFDSQGEMLKQIDSIKNSAMPALATSQSALLGDMPTLEIDKEAVAQIGQTFNEGMGEEFKSAVDNISQLADQLKNQSGAALQQQMVGLLEDMRRSMQSTATASERMAAVASN
jgi:hypothetical protein